MSVPVVEYAGVTKVFAGSGRNSPVTAIEDVSLRVDDGEVVSLIGPSGCGKSTLLNLGAGLDRPTRGEVFAGGEPVVEPNEHVAFMLQKDLLLPWRTVRANVELGLEIRGAAANERRDRSDAFLRQCRIADFAESYPHELSGGMRQRAALARTLAVDPRVLLLDEPFSALDAQTKMVLQEDLARSLAAHAKTALFITHDLTEAIALSDRVLVTSRRPGRIVEELAVDLPDRDAPIVRRQRGFGASAALLVVFLAAWEWGPAAVGIPPYILPPASSVLDELFRMTGTDRVFFHTAVTAGEVAAGFVLGAVLGMSVGYVLGMSPSTEFVLSPYILALQIAPKVAFAPLFVLWFGFTVTPKILVAILIVFFPIMVNVLGALRTVDPDLVNLARSFRASRAQIFWKIEFRASMPALFSGLRIGSTLAVIGVVVGELVGGNMGLGYLLVFGEGAGNTAMVFVSIILLTAIGIVAYVAVVLAERRVLHYLPRRTYQQF